MSVIMLSLEPEAWSQAKPGAHESYYSDLPLKPPQIRFVCKIGPLLWLLPTRKDVIPVYRLMWTS